MNFVFYALILKPKSSRQIYCETCHVMSDVLTAKLTELDEKGLEYDEEVILILGKALFINRMMTKLILDHNICTPFVN